MTAVIPEQEVQAPVRLDEKSLTFTLGDLIREGVRHSPSQTTQEYGNREASCALGAMAIAAQELGIGTNYDL